MPSLLEPKFITVLTLTLLVFAIVFYRLSRAEEAVLFWEINPVGQTTANKAPRLFDWLSRKAAAMFTFAATGALLTSICAAILLGLIAVNTTIERAVAATPVALTLALSLGTIAGSIVGAIEGGEE